MGSSPIVFSKEHVVQVVEQQAKTFTTHAHFICPYRSMDRIQRFERCDVGSNPTEGAKQSLELYENMVR